MFRITKEFSFSASHVLGHLPDGHPCARLHGHNYRVVVVIESATLDDRGFCRADYRDLDPFKAYLDGHLDHRHLNEVLPCPTTAEHLARFLCGEARKVCPSVTAVRVSETAKTWAEYRHDPP